MMLIYRFSSEADPIPIVTSNVRDKLLHLAEYAGLAMLFSRALAGEGFRLGRACLHAVLLTIAYGAIDEYHQWFVPLRSADVRDWIADAGGAAAGALCFALTCRAFTVGREWCRELLLGPFPPD
jgi:VanZ family protein